MLTRPSAPQRRVPHAPRARRARGRATIIAGAAALLILTACASPIGGSPVVGLPSSQIGPPIDSGTVSLRHDYEETPQEINEYWTEDRREGATPKDPTPGEGGTVDGSPDPATGVVVDPSTGAVDPDGPQLPESTTGEPFVATGLAAATQGRLYISFDDGDYVCSATVVNAVSRAVVATAAHCLWDFSGGTGWGSNVMFVPNDADDSAVAPYGYWYAEAAHGPQEFADTATVDDRGGISGDGWSYDFAFLSMAANDEGQEIQDVTGGQGIAFGVPAEELVVIGYPSADPFDGLSQRYCTSDDWSSSIRSSYAITCDMTQGASGGGWLTNYDPTTGAGYLVATTSYRGDVVIGAMPLGETALQSFTAAGGL